MINENDEKLGSYTKKEWRHMIKTGVVSGVSEAVLDFIKPNIFERKNEEFMEKEKKKESEGRIQAEAYQWFNNTYDHLRGLLYHVPNGEKRDKITANKLKAMGVVPGIPDIVFHYRQRTYFFEFKKPGGSLSDAQEEIHAKLDLMRFMVWTVDTVEEFQMLINNIINDESQQFTLGTTKADFVYRNNIFTYLYDLEFNREVTIEELTSKETRNKFIYFVQEFITEAYDRQDNFYLRFSNDYKRIIKHEQKD